MTRWDRRKRKVIVEMSWEEARDLAEEIRSWDPHWADSLKKAALEGAGF